MRDMLYKVCKRVDKTQHKKENNNKEIYIYMTKKRKKKLIKILLRKWVLR